MIDTSGLGWALRVTAGLLYTLGSICFFISNFVED